MDWKDVIVAISASIAALAIISRWMAGWIKASILAELNDAEGGALTLIRQDLRAARVDIQRLELETVKIGTWLEMNKALLASRGGATHGSPYALDIAWLRERIKASGYVSPPDLLLEFRQIVESPLTPVSDSVLWSLIEQRIGSERIAQETARLGADGHMAPAIWILSARRAQAVGVDSFLREIGVHDAA